MSQHHFNDNAYGISLPPISLPLFTSEPLPHANKKSSIQDRRKKVRLPSFQELSGMVESRQEKVVVPLTQQTKNFNPTANNSSWTRSIRPKQLLKKGILHHKKKPSIIQNKCHSCNSTETPEWRKGPLGPRTLCNACGLIWTKLCKQYENESGPEHQDNSSRDKHHLSFLLT